MNMFSPTSRTNHDMNIKTISNIIIHITLRHVIIAVVTLAMAPPSLAITRSSNDDRLYQQLVNGDLMQLRRTGTDMITTKPDSSLMYFSAVVARYADDLKPDEKEACIGSLNNLGYIYFYEFNNPVKSYDYLLKALKMSEETGIDSTLPHIFLNIANVYASMGEGGESVKYLKKSIQSSAALKAYDILVISFIGLLNQIYVAEAATLDSITGEIETFRNSGIEPSTELYRYATLFLKGIQESAGDDYDDAVRTFGQALKTIDSTIHP